MEQHHGLHHTRSGLCLQAMSGELIVTDGAVHCIALRENKTMQQVLLGASQNACSSES